LGSIRFLRVFHSLSSFFVIADCRRSYDFLPPTFNAGLEMFGGAPTERGSSEQGCGVSVLVSSHPSATALHNAGRKPPPDRRFGRSFKRLVYFDITSD
jgi:hypothetical protein